jgi:hypothetical protein
MACRPVRLCPASYSQVTVSKEPEPSPGNVCEKETRGSLHAVRGTTLSTGFVLVMPLQTAVMDGETVALRPYLGRVLELYVSEQMGTRTLTCK